MDNEYKIVEHPDSDFYAIQLIDPSPWAGVRFIYGTVSIKESPEIDMATLSFSYNINDPGDFDHDDLKEDEGFNNYIGEILGFILEEGTIAQRDTDTRTEPST